MKTLLHRALVVALGTLSVVTARAQSPQNPIPISSAPFVITQSGYYRLTNNINYDPGNNNQATIIKVNASNVTIDFNGFYIAGPVGNINQAVYGIEAFERSNLTIKNGTIAFCFAGAFITGNGQADTNNVGYRIERMRVTYCYAFGITIFNAPSSIVRDCQVSQIGGTSAASGNGTAFNVAGAGLTLRNNLVTTVTASGSGTATGIFAGPAVFLVGNTVANCQVGVQEGICQGNLTFNCATPFASTIDAGGNN